VPVEFPGLVEGVVELLVQELKVESIKVIVATQRKWIFVDFMPGYFGF
jgi:hypothetical protein